MPDIEQRLTRIERKLDLLLREEKKKHPEDQWIPEDEAAAKLNWHPTYLRRLAKAGKVPIQYKSINNRNFKYNSEHLLKFMDHAH